VSLLDALLIDNAMNEERCGNGGTMESVEKAGFPLFSPFLGNLAKNARFPHSHSSSDEAMEKWKTENMFPTFPRPYLLS